LSLQRTRSDAPLGYAPLKEMSSALDKRFGMSLRNISLERKILFPPAAFCGALGNCPI
jgi:hypothetical protein